MTLTDDKLSKAPFPYFGGKRDAAPTVWALLGDVSSYVEPFAGSLAVLMCRPHEPNRAYCSETVNDLDGLLVNFWRAVQADPEAVADAASWPVSEVDLMARHIALVRWKDSGVVERMRADPDLYDAKMAGWWAWGLSAWIGSGWCSGTGPWTERDGVVVKQGRGARAAGVAGQLPHLTSDGQGVNSQTLREPGVAGQLPHLHDNGKGVNSQTLRLLGVGEPHPTTMPELVRWLRFLSARLRHVRICQGPWERVCSNSVVKTLSVKGDRKAGVFLDPPYAHDKRDKAIYAHDEDISADVRAWAIKAGADPMIRVVIAGYGDEHDALLEHGWSKHEWYKGGFLKGGMGNISGKSQAHLDRLWASPACLPLGAQSEGEPSQEALL